MSVLNKYNQRVIAILGTISIIAVSVVIIIASIFMVEEFFASRNYTPYESGITVEEPEEGKPTVRDQQISFQQPVRIDSANQLYVIPVGQVNLENPELILGLLDTRSPSMNLDYSGYYDLNNLILYDLSNSTNTPLFNQKTSIENFEVVKTNDRTFLLISAATRDTDKNGRLNSSDLQSLFIYDLSNREMHQFEREGSGLSKVDQLYKTQQVVAFFTRDKNGDGNINGSSEPHIPIIISLLDFTEKDMVPNETVKALQQIVE